MSTITEIATEIARRKQELAELEQKLEEAKTEPEDIRLARQLHDLLCQWNHTAGCSWYYESKNKKEDWTGYAHDRYLTKARRLTHQCQTKNISTQDAIEIFKMVKE